MGLLFNANPSMLLLLLTTMSMFQSCNAFS
jgi:hypothetical protein